MGKNSPIRFALVALFFGIFTYSLPFILPEERVFSLVKEDSIVEYLGALFFFLAAVCFVLAFYYAPTGNHFWKIKTSHNLIFLGFALILMFGAGEEISWGQRILGYGTPAALEENKQDELTLHNLPLFDPTNEDSLINMNRMFTYFWFTFGILIPGAAMLYKPLRDWLKELGFPVAPILLGGQFLLFYVLSKFFGILDVDKPLYEGRLVEFRETVHALIFCLIALTILLAVRSQRGVSTEKPAPTPIAATGSA